MIVMKVKIVDDSDGCSRDRVVVIVVASAMVAMAKICDDGSGCGGGVVVIVGGGSR